MAKESHNNALPYTEAQSRTLLSWLARGMHMHGQTVFMVEQLQPSWLATSYERAVYTLSSRLIVGLIYGLIFGSLCSMFASSIFLFVGMLTFGLIFGLSVGLLDVFRFLIDGALSREEQTQTTKTPSPLWRVISILTVGGVLVFAWFVSATAWMLTKGDLITEGDITESEEALLRVFVVSLVLFIPSFALIWGIRSANRTMAWDIKCFEALAWSWKAILMGIAPCLCVGVCSGLIGSMEESSLLPGILGVLIAAPFGVLIAAAVGLRPRVTGLKTVANQGIRLSMRCAIYGGLIVGLSCGLVAGFIPFIESVSGGVLFYGLGVGLAVALLAGSGFGGLDVLLHYILRLMLYMRGRTPLNLVRFLDYAAKDLNFLQKVGGGYIFIHRTLLEHFAAMEDEAKSNPQDTPALDASTPFESVSDK